MTKLLETLEVKIQTRDFCDDAISATMRFYDDAILRRNVVFKLTGFLNRHPHNLKRSVFRTIRLPAAAAE